MLQKPDTRLRPRYEIYDRMTGKTVATADTYAIALNARAARPDGNRLAIRETLNQE